MGLVFVKLGNLSSYKTLNTQLFFAYLLALLKSWVTSPIVISTCFKMLLLGVLKVQTAYILPPGWIIYSFLLIIRFFECL